MESKMEQENYEGWATEISSDLVDGMNAQDFLAGVYPDVQPRPKVKVEPKPSRANEGESIGNIADDVGHFVARFVFLKNPNVYLLTALWVIGTYLYEHFGFFGYLFLYSPEPESGKSRFLDVLDLLVFNSSGIQVSPTEAGLFRAGKATQLLDEVDTWAEREVQFRAVLNAGFKRGSFVTRMDKSATGEQTPKKHKVYCPRALAGIGPKILSAATRTRTFMVKMEKRTKRERGERFFATKVEPEAKLLQKQIEEWAEQNRERIIKLYEGEELPYLENVSERTLDIAGPLAAILEVLFEGNERLEEVRQEFLEAVNFTRGKVQEVDEGERIICELVRVAKSQEGALIGNATELVEMCGLKAGDEHILPRVLQRHGFEPRSIRKDGGQPLKRYELDRSRLEEIADRYLDVNEPSGAKVETPREDSQNGDGVPM